MKISKILIGSLLVSSSIGNVGSTFTKMDYDFRGLEKTSAMTEKLGYYKNFVEIQPQKLAKIKVADQNLSDNYKECGKSPTPITYIVVQRVARKAYQVATAVCLLVPEPIILSRILIL